MSEFTGTTNQTGQRLKQLRYKIKFMEERGKEEMSKDFRKRFLAELELTRQEERDTIELLEKTGGVMK